MAKKGLCLTGGILMLISIFLPVLWFTASYSAGGVSANASIFYWMFGYAFVIVSMSAGGATASYSGGVFLGLDVLGLICMIIIIIGAILALAMSSSSSKGALVGGILGLLSMIIYYVIMFTGAVMYSPLGEFGVLMIPFLGFFLCIIGGILAIAGGAKS